MDSGPVFALLRSFAELSPMQLERAQEHIGDHLQCMCQALAEQRAVRPYCPHCHATQVIHWGQPMANSVIAVAHAARYSTSYTKAH